MIKAIIFDCFGVVRIDPFEVFYRKYGGDPIADEQFITKTFNDYFAGKISSFNDIFASKFGISVEEWQSENDAGSSTDEDVLDYVLELKKTYRTAMLSNVSAGGLERIFSPKMLDTYFEIAVGSGDIGHAKPEAAAYMYVADKLGVQSNECIFIDDRQDYINGALSVGMMAILYTSLQKLKQDLKLFHD